MSADRGPGGRPLMTWVTLGLLALGWMVLCITFFFAAPGRGLNRLGGFFELAVFWLLVSGPHLLLGYSTLRGSRDYKIVASVMAYAIVGTFFSLSLAAAALLGGSTRVDLKSHTCIIGILSLVAWPMGLWTAYRAHRHPRSQTPEDEE